MEKNDILYGIDEIRPVVGNASHVTIMKWYREYEDFPMRKLRGQWVSSREELKHWWRRFVKGEINKIDPNDNRKPAKKKTTNKKKSPQKTVSRKS